MSPNPKAYSLRLFCLLVVSPVLLPAGAHAAGTPAGAFGNKRALVIGIDGVRSDALQAANTPNMDALIAAGAVSYDAIAGGLLGEPSQQVTSSGPGWTSILTGVWTDKHGVSNNSFIGYRSTSFPHFFKRVREANPAACTASFSQWSPIDTSIVGPVDAYTDHRATPSGGQAVADQASGYVASNHPDVMFLHFDDVDGAGHSSGFNAGNPTYLNAIATVDTQIGEVLAAIEARPNYAAEDWVVVITTDHGGLGTSHGGQSDDERTIFMIASGGAITPQVVSPGPGMTAVPPTVLAHLGIPIDPAWGWEDEPFGQPQICLNGLSCVTDAGAGTVTLSWNPPDPALDATGIKIERDGVEIASLPLTATGYVDTPPLAGAGGFVEFTYTVHTYGGTEGDACPVRQCIAEFFDGDLDTDLVVHLAFDGDTLDTSGSPNINSGTPNGAVSYQGGGLGQCLSFDTGTAPAEYVTLGNPADLDFGTTTDFSVSLWVKTPGGFTTDHAIISNKNWASGGNAGWIIAVNTNGSWQWNIGDGADRADYDGPASQIDDDTWHHLCVVHDRDGNASLYFDGTLAGQVSLGAIGDIDALATAVATDGTLAYDSFPGCVDEVKIWRRKLAAEEVAQLSTAFVPKTCPSGFACTVSFPNNVTLSWNAAANLNATGIEVLRDGTSLAMLPIGADSFMDTPPLPNGAPVDYEYQLRVLGADAALCPELTCTARVGADPLSDLVLDLRLDGDTLDSSGRGNDGSLNGTPVYGDGIAGQSLAFVDTASPHQFVNLGAPGDLNFGTSTDFTVSVWVKNSGGFPDNRGSGGSADDPAIVSNKDWNSGGNTGWLIAAGGNGRWQWNIGDGSGRVDYDGPAGEISDGEWHHLCVVHDRDGDASLYFDGTLVTTRSISGIGDIDSGLPTAVATDGTLGTVWENWFPGSIDAVRIWRRALSPAEVEFFHENDSAWFDWRETWFSPAELLDAGISGALADPFGTGVVNQLVFAQSAAGPGAQPPVGPEISVSPEGFLQITYRRRAGGLGQTGIDYQAGGLRYKVEVSLNMQAAGWQSGEAHVEAVGDPVAVGGGIEEVTVRSRLPLAANRRQFLRLVVEAQ